MTAYSLMLYNIIIAGLSLALPVQHYGIRDAYGNHAAQLSSAQLHDD